MANAQGMPGKKNYSKFKNRCIHNDMQSAISGSKAESQVNPVNPVNGCQLAPAELSAQLNLTRGTERKNTTPGKHVPMPAMSHMTS